MGDKKKKKPRKFSEAENFLDVLMLWIITPGDIKTVLEAAKLIRDYCKANNTYRETFKSRFWNVAWENKATRYLFAAVIFFGVAAWILYNAIMLTIKGAGWFSIVLNFVGAFFLFAVCKNQAGIFYDRVVLPTDLEARKARLIDRAEGGKDNGEL